ncbi:MAG: M36 family metallopeptidase [Rhodanobacteraceae bacterium]|nr:M36 family metallopeptidase [Rhodanobacteraceae bacterium]
MTRRLVFCALVTALTGQAFAAKPGNYPPLQIGVDSDRPSVTRDDGRFDRTTLAPRALYRPAFTATPADAESMARQYLEARGSEQLQLNLRAPGHELRALHSKNFGPFSVVRFQQYWNGLPLHGSEIVVSVTAGGEVIFVQQSLQPVDLAPGAPARIDAATAQSRAAEYLGASGGFNYVDHTEMWWNRDSALRVWRVLLEPKGYPGGSWEVLVDAGSGAIVRVENRSLNFDGSGRAFDPDPLSSAQVAYGATGYVDGSDANTAQLDAQVFTRPLRDLTQVTGNWTLKGPWAECTDWEAPMDANNCPTDAAGNFLFTRDNDKFEGVNVYYHIDTFMRYINTTLNVPIAPYQYVGGVRYDPRGVNGDDNSFYTSGTGRLSFGEGGVDDAEDADVVIHELGHGIHDWLTHGLSQVQGLSEGTGDYLASSYSRSFNHWPSNVTAYFWMFNWDGHNPFWGGRVTNYHLSATYQTLSGAIHTQGQYWASCNLLNYNSIGRQRADRAFLLGLGMTGSSTNQQDAAQAVLNAAAADGYSASELQSMYDNFTAGTTVPANRRCTYVLTNPAGTFAFANGFE